MSEYDSKGYTTENNVFFKFENNYIMAHLFTEPIFCFYENKLTHVQFDGLAITTRADYERLESRVRELEAERDRISKDLGDCLQKQIQMALDALIIERNHAALVEAFEQAEGEHPLSCEYADDARYTWPDRWSIIKAALAEVK
jgi:hypothetical protein